MAGIVEDFTVNINTGAAEANMQSLKRTIGDMRQTVQKSGIAMLAFQNSLGTMGGTAAQTMSKFLGFAQVIATGGPLGIAIAAGTFALSKYADAMNEIDKAAKVTQQSLANFNSAIAQAVSSRTSEAASIMASLGGKSGRLAATQASFDSREKNIASQQQELNRLLEQEKNLRATLIHYVLDPKGMEAQKKKIEVTKETIKEQERSLTATIDIQNAESALLAALEAQAEQERIKEAKRIEDEKQKNRLANANKEMDFAKTEQEGITAIHAGNLEIRAQLSDAAAEADKKRYEDLAKEQKERYDESAQVIGQSLSVVGGATNQLFDDLIMGSKDAGKKFASNMLRGIGTMIFSKGVADMTAALANGFIYGNFAGVGFASAEMTIGTTLMAGGSVVGKAIAKAESGREKSAEAAAEAAAEAGREAKRGGGVRSGGSGGGGRGGGTVIINVQGAMSSADAGREVSRAIKLAAAQGLI